MMDHRADPVFCMVSSQLAILLVTLVKHLSHKLHVYSPVGYSVELNLIKHYKVSNPQTRGLVCSLC